MFISRKEEINKIKNQINSNNKSSSLIYGKRRIGKTTLILESIKNEECIKVYFECILTSKDNNIELLTKIIQKETNNKFIMFKTFKEIFEYLDTLNKKVIIVIDEYQYLKELTKVGEIDSEFQIIIDQMSDNINLIISGSYIRIMKESLEHINPLFGRFTNIIYLKDFNYYESSLFYDSEDIKTKIDYYSVFSGLPYALSLIDTNVSLKDNIKKLIINNNGLLHNYLNHILLSELNKLSNIHMILSALASGKKRYKDIDALVSNNSTGALDKQLKQLIDLDIIEKVYPINKLNDNKKMFYKISNNLVKFYYKYIFNNSGIISILGEDVFYDEYIEPNIKHFISSEFENIVKQYFSIKVKKGLIKDVLNIGTYWYDNSIDKTNGEFDCVLQHRENFSVYEVKCYQNKVDENTVEKEIEQVSKSKLNINKIGFVSLNGFEFENPKFDLISGDDLFEFED